MDDTLIYRMAFASLRGLKRHLAEELLAHVGSEQAFFDMSEGDLEMSVGFSSKLFDSVYREGLLGRARCEANFIDDNGIKTFYFADSCYPVRLAECEDAPLMLYGFGDCDINRGHLMAVVGTRHATTYGIDFVEKIIGQLSETLREPLTVVSGLAFGIDVSAHRAALKFGLPTVGVLAHGLNTMYPAQHRSTAAEMIKAGGMLLTEYMSSDSVNKGNFVARNRIVAGLCDCLLVAESAEKGGALITARLASDYNRDVFALPGRISDRYSAGCNNLISSNVAALVQSADDIVRVMNWAVNADSVDQPSLFPELTDDEKAVADCLTTYGEADINRLSVTVGINVGRLLSLLVDMEFKGLIVTYPGGKYRLA